MSPRTYGCNECGLFLHESCSKIEIPKEIDHYFHPHPLRLAMNEKKHLDSSCQACGELLLGLMFECRDCHVYMDVACASLPTKLKQEGCIDHIQHFKHAHPLILCDDQKKYDPLILCDDQKKYESKLCTGCQGRLTTRPCFSYDTSLLLEGSESIYGCLHLQCEFFRHDRCARLPPKIDSPFHSSHSLELIWSNYEKKCQGCDRLSANYCTYECCGSCKFILGVECALLMPPIVKFKSHNHLLTLFPSVSRLLSCRICNEACDSSNIFRCIDCDYNLHLLCGPLPCSIKDKCHIDPLKLMYAFVYCDACEQPRDPDQCVYYCNDCNFIAEFKCVEAEVLRSLNGERGNVKLRTANNTRILVSAKLISNVITDNVETDSDNEIEDMGAKYLEVELHENFFSGCYTDEEYEQLIEIFKKANVKLRPSPWNFQKNIKALQAHMKRYDLAVAKLQSKGKQEFKTSIFCYSLDEESDSGENTTAELYSDEFKRRIMILDCYYDDDELLEVFFRKDYNIVRIGEHVIVQDSASVLKGLLHKYGDFTTKSKLSQRLKAIFLTMFCEVIRSMCLTNDGEVENEVLHKWWKALQLAQLAGFEIKFAIDRLYKVAQASFGMKAISSYREMKCRGDILSYEIKEEEAKLEAKKRELETLKAYIDKRKYKIEYQSSPVLKKCLKHVSEFKWKKAWDASPAMFR